MGYFILADTDTYLKMKILADTNTNKGKKTHGDTNSVDTSFGISSTLVYLTPRV